LKFHYISPPVLEEQTSSLKIGSHVLISGTIYTARDAAHKRMIKLIEEGKPLPFNPDGQIIYYAGPTPPAPGKVIGAVGPTTSYRMDSYAEPFLKLGLKAMIGKGERSLEVKNWLVQYQALYFVALGGGGAILSKCVKEAEIIAYEDLGPEAIFRLTVENFPVITANDAHGGDLFEIGRAWFKKNKV